MMGSPKAICRFCEATLTRSFVDLGMSPLSNAYLTGEQLSCMEPFYPLRAFVCDSCFLVQLEQYETPAHLFGDYAYFSSYAESWLAHARMYVDSMIDRFGLNSTSQVVEIASNDGYLLQYFQQKDVPVLGVEPAANVAAVARAAGIPTIVKFFGVETARESPPTATAQISSSEITYLRTCPILTTSLQVSESFSKRMASSLWSFPISSNSFYAMNLTLFIMSTSPISPS